MSIRTRLLIAALTVLLSPAFAQKTTPITPLAATAPTVVPALVPYSGVVVDGEGKAAIAQASITFQIYKDQNGGEPIFTETQSVIPDATGHYTVNLGASLGSGMPVDLFSSGEARWLEVQISGEKPEARILLASVPYAFKAADAATLGGLPASAFALAGTSVAPVGAVIAEITPASTATTVTGGGKTGYVPEFSGATSLIDSPILVSGSSVGIGKTPSSTLDVNGSLSVSGDANLHGSLVLNPLGTARATASTSYNSNFLKLFTWAYNSSSKAATQPRFEWTAEVTGNNTSSPSATLNLLASTTTAASAETGFYFNRNGTIHFAPGQTFPAGTGGGTGSITGVTAGTGLKGGGTSGNVTLNVDTTKVPLLAANNTFAGNQTITGNLITGNIGIGTAFPATDLEIVSSKARPVFISDLSYDADAIVANGGTGYGGYGGVFDGGATIDNSPPGGGIMAEGGSGVEDSGGVGGYFVGGVSSNSSPGTGVLAFGGSTAVSSTITGLAGDFYGDVYATGTITGSAKYFRVDHPSDPANKYLNHVSIESSEMMNMYSGNVTTDGSGLSTVSLPSWFETLNSDFRYQLTVVGQFAQAIVKSKITSGQFTIMTNAPNVEVSWMVTAVRQDPYAKAHPVVVEELKPANERGFYLHPELYGQPMEKQTQWGRYAGMMRRAKDRRVASAGK